ncbi:hypothetical protein ACEQ8H_005671 [Pleosporales sp. CAS-2024a]
MLCPSQKDHAGDHLEPPLPSTYFVRANRKPQTTANGPTHTKLQTLKKNSHGPWRTPSPPDPPLQASSYQDTPAPPPMTYITVHGHHSSTSTSTSDVQHTIFLGRTAQPIDRIAMRIMAPVDIPLAKSLLPLACTTTLSSYALFLSYQNISRLRQYEQQSEKAAAWSRAAAARLRKTRTTQATATISLVISFLTPVLVLATPNPLLWIAAAVNNTAMVLLAWRHMGAFWNDKEQTRVPFVHKFNDAVRGSGQVVGLLGMLGVAWGITGLAWVAMAQAWL